jgi:hypothetical protein
MPPRSVVLAIIACWLATTGWLVYRDLLPAFESGAPPPFTIDLADEVSAQPNLWKVLQNGEEIGTARTEVHRRPDRTFALDGDLKQLRNFRVLTFEITRMRSRYVVTKEGDLRELEARVTLGPLINPIEVGFDGKVEDGMFTPVIRISGIDMGNMPLPKLTSVPVTGHGNVLNPMHPLNRLRGLREGQRWVQPLFDPLVAAVNSLGTSLGLGMQVAQRQLHAEVDPALLAWNGAIIPCWKIEYRQPGEKISARTWVRRSDGQVLQQEAMNAGTSLILQRIPSR